MFRTVLIVTALNVAVASEVVEVVLGVRHSRETLYAVPPVEVRAARGALAPVALLLADSHHVIHHRIHDDPHSHLVAPLHHVGELCLIPTSGTQLVAHRLVSDPPSGIGYYLLWYLNVWYDTMACRCSG